MSHDVTQLLNLWRSGDRAALEQLVPLIYDELRRVATRHLGRERAGHTLQPTALVHEAFLRLAGVSNIEWQNRAQFIGVAAEMMRRILVDYARARATEKRGGGATMVELDSDAVPGKQREAELLAVDEALKRLAEFDPRQAKIVEMRYFGGLTIEETAAAVELSPATVKREWTVARAWLHRELSQTG
ncbi:MAG: sigma-70 family RNA polymerase sigma factor [Acidobacteria bacterium]|nr:sigma-70 family RNA polymerase sigma factor [Acidobacteriota bacterium]